MLWPPVLIRWPNVASLDVCDTLARPVGKALGVEVACGRKQKGSWLRSHWLNPIWLGLNWAANPDGCCLRGFTFSASLSQVGSNWVVI